MSAIIRLAILAVGGQGGGVLTGWIEDLARANGYVAQATSVAGVAQRTGATVYYVEMAPDTGRTPVFALMPAAGDVDIMITAELMEAGRAIQRGFVTPDRTVLITSTHRALAVSEKVAPGDGIADPAEVLAAAEIAARRVVAADYEAMAVRAGSVISATLFGALAASGALPFPRAAFEAAIRAGDRGVEGSLRAFAAAFEPEPPPPLTPPPVDAVTGPAGLMAEWQALAARAARLPVAEMALAGLRKVVDFQDPAYGAEYLDRLSPIAAADHTPWDLTREAAKHIANAMAYDDMIRVADHKTRAARQRRIAAEMGVGDGQILHLTEYFHPRAAEIIGLMPARLGERMDASPRWQAWLTRWFARGRRLRSDGLPAFLLLHLLAGARGWRRRTFRHAQEQAHLQAWLQTALAQPYPLAVEMIRCRRLIKGYSDTHARGQSKFDKVMAASLSLAGRADAADWCRRLREAALKDEEGRALDGAIATVNSFR